MAQTHDGNHDIDDGENKCTERNVRNFETLLDVTSSDSIDICAMRSTANYLTCSCTSVRAACMCMCVCIIRTLPQFKYFVRCRVAATQCDDVITVRDASAQYSVLMMSGSVCAKSF